MKIVQTIFVKFSAQVNLRNCLKNLYWNLSTGTFPHKSEISANRQKSRRKLSITLNETFAKLNMQLWHISSPENNQI